MTHPHDPRRGPPAAPHDPGDLLRARLARAAVLHAATLAVYVAAVQARAPDPKEPPVALLAAAAGLAALSGAALLATLRLSPDPDRGREATAWVAGLSPKAKGWLGGLAWLAWLVLLGVGREPGWGGGVSPRALTCVALYLAAVGLVALAAYEGENAYRSRTGLPPRPKPPAPEPERESEPPPSPELRALARDPAGLLRRRARAAALLHGGVLLAYGLWTLATEPHRDGSDARLVAAAVLTPLLVAAASATRCLSPDPARTWSWRRPLGVRGPRAAALVWAVVGGAALLGLGHADAGARTGSRLRAFGGGVLAYALAAAGLAAASYEGVGRYRARSPVSPGDDVRQLLDAYEAGRIDRDELEAELRSRGAPPGTTARPRRTIDPD